MIAAGQPIIRMLGFKSIEERDFLIGKRSIEKSNNVHKHVDIFIHNRNLA